ncbi:MAG: biotin/lipoyl-containing protein, partial [Methylocella sp.]
MAKEIRVPVLGESVTEATIGKWFRQAGEAVKADEPLVELETDKVTVEVPSPASGKLASIAAKPGSTVNVGALLGSIEEGAAGVAPVAKKAEAPPPAKKVEAAPLKTEAPLSPAVRKMVEENRVEPAAVAATGRNGRITKGDVIEHLAKPAAVETKPLIVPPALVVRAPSQPGDSAREERVRMSRLRQTIARRLKDAQNTAAMLTTWNEADMTAVMALRNEFKEMFEKKHGVKLGFMSFFVKACIQALKDIP